jgi:flagellar hook-associated protein 2
VSATNALATINNIQVSSASNTIDSAIPGASITLLKKDPSSTVTLTVGQDLDAGKTLVKAFVTAFNDLMDFANDQASKSAKGETANIGRDALLRGLRLQLRTDINTQYSTGSTFNYLSQVGLGFDRSGKLTFDESRFDAAVKSGGTDAIQKLFGTPDGTTGAFNVLQTHIATYTDAGGLVPDAKDRIDAQLQSLGTRIDAMEARLAVERDALNKQFIATDNLMTSLNSSVSSLSTLSNQYRLF